MIREHVRLAALFESWVEAETGWELAHRGRPLVCFRREGSDEENEALFGASTMTAGSSSRTRS